MSYAKDIKTALAAHLTCMDRLNFGQGTKPWAKLF
jgi:hypothetical protein